MRTFLLASIAVLTTTASAFADDAAARAEVLFRDAQYQMKQGRYAEACPKLAESHRLDPTGNTLTVLAACYEGERKWASAWSKLQVALEDAKRAGDAPREAFVQGRIAAIAPKVSRLTITISPGARAVPGLVVERDGVAVPAGDLELAIPTDPGEHVIVAHAPNRKPFERSVRIGEDGASSIVEIPELGQPSSTLRTVGFVTAGVGVGGVAIGSIFGALAMSKKSEADLACGPTTCGTKAGADANADAKTDAVVSTIAFIAGGALVATGALLVIVGWPRTSREQHTALSPVIGPGWAGVEGRW